jgi:DNA helicase IV
MMILAPNQLFLNYIADVLPELGVDQVQQTTFTDFVQLYIGGKYKQLNQDDKLLILIFTLQETDLKLLYVSMTRPLQRLKIFTKTSGIQPLRNVGKAFYTQKEGSM